MIYKVKDDYQGCYDFFQPSDVFEGIENPKYDSIQSNTATGDEKRIGFTIHPSQVEQISETWKEAKEKYPEYFL